MKKLALVLSIFALVFGSCSKNDAPQPDQLSIILPKKMVSTASGSTITDVLSYVDNKLVTKASDDGSKEIYSYTGNLITKIEFSNSSNVVNETSNYFYSNGRLAYETFVYGSIVETINYTYNSDGTVSFVKTSLDSKTNNTTIFYSGRYTYLNGNLVKKEVVSSGSSSTTIYEYDVKNSVGKNIEGFSLLMGFEETVSLNNCVKFTKNYVGNATPYIQTNQYTYNSDNYPVTILAAAPYFSHTVQYSY